MTRIACDEDGLESFFFQAEDGIRDLTVTGVQTCALPISLLAVASAAQAPAGHAARGILAALAAGALWGTMYIPYRKAYVTGMKPLLFVGFFTIGELGVMLALGVNEGGGPAAVWRLLAQAKDVLLWVMLGGFVWVVCD